MRTSTKVREEIDATKARRDSALSELQNQIARREATPDDSGVIERIANLNTGVRNFDEQLERLESEYGRTVIMERAASDFDNREHDDTFEGGDKNVVRDDRVTRRRGSGPHEIVRGQALRAIERIEGISAEAGDRLTNLVERDRSGTDARYIAAVSDPDYEMAFGRLLARPQTAHFELSREEAAAVREVQDATVARAMSIGSSGDGGFAVPAALDPTFMLVSDGAINPLRQLVRVTTIATSEWKGITTEGVSATFDAEAADVNEDSPTLVQPSIFPERMTCYVKFSFEAAGDIPNLTAELGQLFADAKDVLEATKFLFGSGHGSKEPEGLITGLDSGSVIDTDTINTFVADDVYGLQAELPPRFQPRASWLSSQAVASEIYRMSGPGSEEPPLLVNGRLLGKPWNEASDMSSETTTGGEKILVYGDLAAGYRIVDRVGLTVELQPHVINTSTGLPTGQRGLIMWARVGGGVIADNAIRLTRVKVS